MALPPSLPRLVVYSALPRRSQHKAEDCSARRQPNLHKVAGFSVLLLRSLLRAEDCSVPRPPSRLKEEVSLEHLLPNLRKVEDSSARRPPSPRRQVGYSARRLSSRNRAVDCLVARLVGHSKSLRWVEACSGLRQHSSRSKVASLGPARHRSNSSRRKEDCSAQRLGRARRIAQYGSLVRACSRARSPYRSRSRQS